jgi:hypothetical protein
MSKRGDVGLEERKAMASDWHVREAKMAPKNRIGEQKMKRAILFTTVAGLALSFPAMAQTNANGPTQPSSHQQQSQAAGSNSQMGKQAEQQNPSQMQASNNQQQKTIQPSSLTKQEVREIQRNLDQQGFNAKRVDGIWGRETEDALRNFQQTKHLPGNGQLNEQTLSALGVNINNQSQAQNASGNQNGQQGQAQTVGQSQNGTRGQTNGAAGQKPQNK